LDLPDRLSQVLARLRRRRFRPEAGGQVLAVVRLAAVKQKVTEDILRLAALQLPEFGIVAADVKTAKKREGVGVHGFGAPPPTAAGHGEPCTCSSTLDASVPWWPSEERSCPVSMALHARPS